MSSATDDVTATLKLALEASGCNRANVVHKPRLLSDNGSSYISGALAEWLEDHGMDHLRGAPYHPQTQGKIERWHQTLKNRILLENYYTRRSRKPDQRLRRSLQQPTLPREHRQRNSSRRLLWTPHRHHRKEKKDQKLTTQNRRLNHQSQAAYHQTKMSQILPYETRSTVPFVLMTDRGHSTEMARRRALVHSAPARKTDLRAGRNLVHRVGSEQIIISVSCS